MNARKSNQSANRVYQNRHRFEHWYCDNQAYFITARCREKFPAFAGDEAKSIFWSKFDHYTAKHGFTPWVTSLLDNHYHTLGYLRRGIDLAPMLKGIHGSTAKLVNDLLQAGRINSPCLTDGRLVPFWGDARKTYFDGCIRDETQAHRAYRYVMLQSERHGICSDWRLYPHTRIGVELERALTRAAALNAFLRDVPYKRYESGKGRGN